MLEEKLLEEGLLRRAIGLVDALREKNNRVDEDNIEHILASLEASKESERYGRLNEFCLAYDHVLWKKMWDQYHTIWGDMGDLARRVTPSKQYRVSYGRILKNALAGSVLGLLTGSVYGGLAGAAAGAGLTLLDETTYYGRTRLANIFVSTLATWAVLHYLGDKLPFIGHNPSEMADICAAGFIGMMMTVTEFSRAHWKANDIKVRLLKIEGQYSGRVKDLVEKYTSPYQMDLFGYSPFSSKRFM